MATFLERYQSGEHVQVWDDLTELGKGVRHELYYDDAVAVAAETMRRARHNVEELIRRLESRNYRFSDAVSSAEDKLSRLGGLDQLAAAMEARAKQHAGQQNAHTLQMMESMRAMKAKMAPMLEKIAAEAAQAAAARRKPALEDEQVFSPPDKTTARKLAKLEKAAGGPLPISLRAWYEQIGGVSLIGSHPSLNPVDFSGNHIVQTVARIEAAPMAPPQPVREQPTPDPLVVLPIEELLSQAEDGEGEGEDGELQLVIAPDDLHKANISGDAYYITLPDAGADFKFDDGRGTTFVKYLRLAFQWGGFPGWERCGDAPRRELAELAEGLLPI